MASPEDRRSAPRFPLILEASYLKEVGGAVDLTENLSAGGLFIRTERNFKEGDRIPLVLSFPGLLEPLQVTVQVVRIQPALGPDRPRGVGVRVPADCAEDLVKLGRLAQCAAAPGSPRPKTRAFQVLVVEDNVLLARMYGATLKPLDAELGVEVTLAKDGVEAVARLAKPPPIDLVITDLVMPNLDGLELISRIRADPLRSKLPIVVVSAAGKYEEARSMNLGANAFLRKPLNMTDVLATVRALLVLRK